MSNRNRKRIRIRHVLRRTGWSRVTIWRKYTKCDFPKPHYIDGSRCWFEDEVDAWISAHTRESFDYNNTQARLV